MRHFKIPPSRQRVRAVLTALSERYPNPRTELVHDGAWQLLIATILSAQCTDKRVNIITPRLFGVFPDAFQLGGAPLEQVEALIQDCGLYHTKARNIIGTSAILAERFGGAVPEDRETLESLPGVGRKTANVVLSNAFGHPAIAVDTHVFRVSHRLGWSTAKEPLGTERDLMAVIPKRQWSDAHHWLILHGRQVCKAIRPQCAICPVMRWCPRLGISAPLEEEA